MYMVRERFNELAYVIMEATSLNSVSRLKTLEEPMLQMKSEGCLLENFLLLGDVSLLFYPSLQLIR